MPATPVHTEFRDDRFTAAFERRKDDPTTYTRRLYRAGGLARKLCAAAGGGRGHVPARPLRPHRDRRGGGRPRQMSRIRSTASTSPQRGEAALAPGKGAFGLRAPSPHPLPKGRGGPAACVEAPCGLCRDRRGVARRGDRRRLVGRVRGIRAAAARARSRSRRRWCSTATASCSGPISPAKAAGGCRPRASRSIRDLPRGAARL